MEQNPSIDRCRSLLVALDDKKRALAVAQSDLLRAQNALTVAVQQVVDVRRNLRAELKKLDPELAGDETADEYIERVKKGEEVRS